MQPTDKFRTVSRYGDLSPSDLDLIDRTLLKNPEVNHDENREIQDIIPEFDGQVTIFDDRVTWMWRVFVYSKILYGFEGQRGYLLIYDVGAKQTLQKTWFGPMVKTESRLLIVHMVDDLTDRTLTGGHQAVSIGGWVMDRPGPEHAHMEMGKDYKVGQPISFIEPSGDHSVRFDWLLGDRLEATIHPEPGRRGFAMSPFYGRLKSAQPLAMLRPD